MAQDISGEGKNNHEQKIELKPEQKPEQKPEARPELKQEPEIVINPGILVPTKIFFTKGVGIHKDKLTSFEIALRKAEIAACNLVCVSSILPPGCKIISKEQGTKCLRPGQITFCVMARNETNEPNRLIAASVGLAAPADPEAYGYLSEHHSCGETEEKAGDYVEDLAASMLASIMDIEFDADKDWDERKQEFQASGKIIRTREITQSAEGNKDGLWTSVLAAAVFIT